MIKAAEKGFTLVEVLAAIAILSAIVTVTSAAVVVVMRTTSQNNEWNVNMRQVQNAGHWISHDALMAQEVDTTIPGTFLALSWSDWDGNSYNVEYFFDGDMLKRRLNGGPETLIAEYIIPPPATTCTWCDTDNKLTVTIKASLHGEEGRCVEKTYEINPRPAIKGG